MCLFLSSCCPLTLSLSIFLFFLQRFSTVHLLWALQEFSLTRRSLGDKQGSWRWGGEALFLSQHSAFSSSTVFLWPSCILSLLCSLCRGLRPLPCESCPRGDRLLCTDAPASWTDSCCGVVISTHTRTHTHTHTLSITRGLFSSQAEMHRHGSVKI